MPPVIKARGLSRRYGAVTAVSGINIDLPPGTMLGVAGPDASGKTTLLQMLAGILDPSSGTCEVLGHDTRTAAKRISRHLGYMSQGFTLYDRLTVDENLAFAAHIRTIEPETYRERRRRLLRMAGLEDVTGRPAGKLSGGMRKKLSLIGNLIHEPSLLILDEPGLGVDPQSRRQLWQMLEEFRQRGVTMVVGTSYMDEAERCDRVMLLRDGECIASGTPAALRESVRGRAFEVPTPDNAETASLLQSLDFIYGVQWLPGRVRFLTPADGETSGIRDRFPPHVDVRPAEPALEDLFVVQTAGGDDRLAAVSAGPRSYVGETGIRADSISVRFGSFYAVKGLDLRVPSGRLLALLGPNGSGKTTLIKALCGLLPLAGGSTEIAGLSVSLRNTELRRHIGYMSQRYSLYRDLSPLENLQFFANAYGLGGTASRQAIGEISTLTGTHGLPEQPSGDLSGATRQSLALACSLLHRPPVLFLDEPTSGVDPLSRYRFWRLIRSLADAGMTVLVTTHNLEEADYCDSIGLMMRGRLIAFGSGPQLRRELDLDEGADMEAVFVTAIERAGEDLAS